MNLDNAKMMVITEREYAEDIMNGGENYDGADGARTVLDLCNIIDWLIKELEG